MRKLLFIIGCLVLTYQYAFSQDGLNSWTQTYNNQGRVYAIVVNPQSTNIMYIAGLDSGVYKSLDNGASWSNINGTIAYPKFLSLAICAGSPNVLYAGTDQNGGSSSGVYKTTDGGATWTLLVSGITDNLAIQSITVHPTNPNIAYIAVFDGVNAATNGVYKTTNGGTNWTAASTGITNKNILTVMLNPVNPNTVYAGSSLILPGSTGPSTIYKSYDAGNSWSLFSTGLPTGTTTGDPIRAMSMSTLDTNTVLAALFENDTTGGTYLTTNGGTSWNKKWGIPNTVGTLTRACLIRPGSNTEFYMGIDQSSATGLMGVYRTTDGGATWVDFSGGLLLNTYPVRALAFKSDLISPTLYAGAANTTLGAGRGVFEYTFPSTVSLVWSEQTSGTPQILYSISAADNNNVWACGAAGVVSRTTNGGVNWTAATGNIPTTEAQYNIWAVDGNTALVTGSSTITHTYMTTNGGTNWTTVFTQTGGFIDNIWMVSATNGFMNGDPVGGRWSLWKTTNGGVNWDSTGLFLAQNGSETGFNNSMIVSGNNIWMGTSTNRVYYSTNYGTSWTAQTVDAQTNGIASFWSNNPSSGKFFLGSDSLMVTTNSGTNWNFAGVQPGAGTLTGAMTGTGTQWWYARQASVIYYSSNDGVSWSTQYTAPAGLYYDFSKSRTGPYIWAVRSNGAISKYGIATGITPIASNVPTTFSLSQNYPNPFNPVTKINFAIPKTGFVTLKIYDILGREMRTLINESVKAGNYSVEFNATTLSSGVYFYRLISDNFTDTKKMMLIK